MSKESKLISGFAAVGLLVAAFFFIFVAILGVVDGGVYTAMVVLCPTSLLSIPLSEVIRDKSSFYAICSLLALLNSGLYAVIGAAIAGISAGRVTNETRLTDPPKYPPPQN